MLTPLESNILGTLLARFEFGDQLQDLPLPVGQGVPAAFIMVIGATFIVLFGKSS